MEAQSRPHGRDHGGGLAIAKWFAASGATSPSSPAGAARSTRPPRASGRGREGTRGRSRLSASPPTSAAPRRRHHGKIDIVVNNADRGVRGDHRRGAGRDDFDQKLFAAIRLTRLVWPQMKERRWGRVSTCYAPKAPRARSAPTSITRAAGLALTKVLAGEGAPHNVLVNALLVGFIEADQHVQAAAKAGIALKDYIATRAKEVPLGRVGRAEEFAIADAGSYITGTAINVDGGRSPVGGAPASRWS